MTASEPVTAGVARIAVGVDGYAEGRDAAVLAAVIARASAADLMLVAVHPDPMVPMPREMNWKSLHQQAGAMVRALRDEVAPDARTEVVTDWSVPQALERVVSEHHRDLLVVGSSRRGPEGRVRIGDDTRELLNDAPCALAVAPRGYAGRGRRRLESIGVGYDGAPESCEALVRAGALAVTAGARLRVRAVVDDRPPSAGWLPTLAAPIVNDLIEPEVDSLRRDAEAAVSATGADAEIEVTVGSPAEALRELSGAVDLLVIGSRRWGAAARVLGGSTGEALLHGASGPVMVVPRAPA
jgi:nucleotide-binding universal stress UspA family protein